MSKFCTERPFAGWYKMPETERMEIIFTHRFKQPGKCLVYIGDKLYIDGKLVENKK